jgi:chromosome segregation ATPase
MTHRLLLYSGKEEDIIRARLEITRSARELEDLKKKMLASEKSKEDLIGDRTRLKADVADLKTQIGEHKHHVGHKQFFYMHICKYLIGILVYRL